MEKNNIRIIGDKVKKNNLGLHPIFLTLLTSNSNVNPTKPYFDKEKNKYEFWTSSEKTENYKRKMLTSFMEKPYVPFSVEMILRTYNIMNNINSLESFYDNKLYKNEFHFIYIFNCWFRKNITQLDNVVQLDFISKFCKKVIKDFYKKDIDKKNISKKLLKWKSKNKESDFEYKLLKYLIK